MSQYFWSLTAPSTPRRTEPRRVSTSPTSSSPTSRSINRGLNDDESSSSDENFPYPDTIQEEPDDESAEDPEDDPRVPDPPAPPRVNMAEAARALVQAARFSFNPYDKPLNLDEKHGAALYQTGASKLDVTFDGKGESLAPFLANLKLRASKCHWTCLTLGVHNMLTRHGEITEAEVTADHETYLAHQGDPAGNPGRVAGGAGFIEALTVPIHRNDDGHDVPHEGSDAMREYHANVKKVIDRKMLFECIEASLTTKYKKSISSTLNTFSGNGVSLLWYLISNTDVATTLATRDLKLSLQNLSLKAHSWDPKKMHNYVNEVLTNIGQTGETISNADQIMYLIEGYKKENKNQVFITYINSLESQWLEGTITTRGELEAKVITQYQAMIRNKTWKMPKEEKKTTPSNQTPQGTGQAFRADGGGNRNQNQNMSHEQQVAALKARNAAWKFDMSLSATNSLTKNGKEYKKCSGPGHYNVPMWVLHTPGQCNASRSNYTPRQGGGGGGSGGGGSSTPSSNTNSNTGRTSRSDFRAAAAQILQNSSNYGDDVQQIVDQLARSAYD